jgi:formate dehydrogenase major subunit
VSLLKAYYGNKATKDNSFGYDLLPKLGETDNFSWGYIFDRMYSGQFEGLITFGMNPVANGPNTPKMLSALQKLKWLIVADCFETETASFWKARDLAGKYYPTAPEPSDVSTEVFLLPAACFAEKDGAFVNSSRWAQWKNIALDPPGEAWRDQDIIARLFLKIRELYESEGGTAPEPVLNMAWDWQNPLSPSLSEVAREINGRDAAGKQLASFSALTADGSTACGNWIYTGSYTEAGNMMARRGLEDPTGLGLYPNWAWNWPANRRILYNRASADASGKPWDAARAPLRWTGSAWTGDVPDCKGTPLPTLLAPSSCFPKELQNSLLPTLSKARFPSITSRWSRRLRTRFIQR